MNQNLVKLFLRLALSLGFLSAVADRFGLYPAEISVWGTWQSFVDYTGLINPWLPISMVSPAAIVATVVEVVFGFALLIGFKTELFARLSGVLLLVFALAMTFSLSAKAPLDYSVYAAAAASFALATMNKKYLEVDSLLGKKWIG
ncbi:DoxX family membrane protein [Algoriphagus sp. A40]|uniref:DoxX family membrane protein n=1 Tax=Algoriphagus sp. A40 TaxID=1945863 RepID=UPI00098498AD|nr:DoxX family membrane protein [Algoriphagus sp. A40]OOG75342.1 DoxX family protein [Algoriphagus sp. A40]